MNQLLDNLARCADTDGLTNIDLDSGVAELADPEALVPIEDVLAESQ